MTTPRGSGTGRPRWGSAAVSLLAVAGLVAGCSGSETVLGPDGATPVEPSDIRLVSYDSCDALLDWFHTEASARVGPYGLDGGDQLLSGADSAFSGSAPRSASDAASAPTTLAQEATTDAAGDASSTTNTQEPGIGEPDLVWTDGTRLATLVNGRLDLVDLTTGAVTAGLELPGSESGDSPVGLLVQDDHALVVQRSYGYGTDGPAESGVRADDAIRSSMPVGAPVTRLTRIDLDPSPTVVGSVAVDGEYVDARMVDGVVRAVVRSSPAQLGFVYPSGSSQAAIDRATEANREVVAESTIEDWLPTMTVEVDGAEGTTGTAVDCAAVDHPASYSGFGVVTVVGLDLGAGAVEPLPAAAVVADAQTVYASTDALYLATPRWPSYGPPTSGGTAPTTVPTRPTVDVEQAGTEVHAFSLPVDVSARYEASGFVPGTLLDQFALSRHEGDLRVATTVQPGTWSQPVPIEGGAATGAEPSTREAGRAVSESLVTVLRQEGDVLTTVGQVAGLGPTEQIRGVRFAGPTAYVVTFRQTDPLYVVDLSDPTAPRVAGELKIPGYSSYLQQIGDGRVVGLGQDATDRGITTGFQESLFDVSDPASPRRVAQLVVPNAFSAAEADHHALLWWAPTGLLAVPVESWGGPGADVVGGYGQSGVLVTRVTDTTIDEVGTITHPRSDGGGIEPWCPPDAFCTQPAGPPGGYPTPIARTLVADGRLVTVSGAGVKVSDLTTLADLAWIPLAP